MDESQAVTAPARWGAGVRGDGGASGGRRFVLQRRLCCFGPGHRSTWRDVYQSATVVPLMVELALVERAARSFPDLDERVRLMGAEWRVVEVGVISGREVREVQSVHVRSVPTDGAVVVPGGSARTGPEGQAWVERWQERKARAAWAGAAAAGRAGERIGAGSDLVG